MINFSDIEMGKIKQLFPKLFYDIGENTIKGKINVSARYGKNGGEHWKIFPCRTGENECITDCYDIEILLGQEHKKFDGPPVFEVAGRIENLAKERKLDLMDLHLYPSNKSCCLGIFTPNEKETLSDFVLKKVYPYFVWQAYFEKYNEVPPGGEYPHGIYEALAEFGEKLKTLGSDSLCPCGSGTKVEVCCPEILKTLPHERLEYFKQERLRILHNKAQEGSGNE